MLFKQSDVTGTVEIGRWILSLRLVTLTVKIILSAITFNSLESIKLFWFKFDYY